MRDLAMPWKTAPELQVDLTSDGLTCVVRLCGELDMTTAAQLLDDLNRVCGGRHRLVVVDLGELRFLGLIGLQVLADAQQALRAAGCLLALANPAAITTRVLALTGLDQVFHLLSDPEHPTAEVAPGGGPVVIA